MPRRHLHPPSARDRLQLLTPAGTWPLEVEEPCYLDAHGEVHASPPRHGPVVHLQRHAEGLEARGLGDGPPVRLNAVQLSGTARLKPGDELELGALRASLVRESPRDHPRVRAAYALEPWLESALLRAAAGEGALWVSVFEPGAAQAESWDARLTPGTVAFALGAGSRVVLSEGPHAVLLQGPVRTARYPVHGSQAPALLAAALGVVDPDEAPLALEPVSLRLAELLAALALRSGPLLLEGEAGVGRAFRATHWLRRAGAASVQRVSGASPGAEAALATSADETLLIEDVERLPAGAQRLLAQRGGRWAATCPPGALLESTLAARLARSRVYIPPLRDRPNELAALVESELGRLRRELGRPGLHLDRGARSMVFADTWPGNLDGVRAALSRAARVATGEWIRAEDLPVRLREQVMSLGLEEAREAAERTTLLQALHQTRWNVAETARRLGLPRRTLVHRMKVVGLKRPPRGS